MRRSVWGKVTLCSTPAGRMQPPSFFFFLFYNFILTGLLTTKDCSRPWSCLDLSLTWEFLAGQNPARSLDTAGDRSVFVARIHAMTESL